MKILILLAACVTPAAAAAQSAVHVSAGAKAEDVAALEALNRDWLTAYRTRDGAALDRVLADEFEAVYQGGRIMKKADVIAFATDTARTVTEVGWDELKILVFGDVALVRGRSRLAGTGPQGAFASRSDYADVYARRGGTWRAVSAHVVRVE